MPGFSILRRKYKSANTGKAKELARTNQNEFSRAGSSLEKN
jgi:hypothetical protein